jgi:hypothetical protein
MKLSKSEQRLLLKILKNIFHLWIGHIIRRNEFVLNFLEKSISGNKAMGRALLKYLKQVARKT